MNLYDVLFKVMAEIKEKVESGTFSEEELKLLQLSNDALICQGQEIAVVIKHKESQ